MLLYTPEWRHDDIILQLPLTNHKREHYIIGELY